MNYLVQLFKRNGAAFSSIAIAASFLFIVVGLSLFFLLKDTAGRAGFELYCDISELLFAVILFFALLYNSSQSYKVIQKPTVRRLLSWIIISFFIVTAILMMIFFISDLIRSLVSLGYSYNDNFTRLSSPRVFLFHNVYTYFLSGPLLIKMSVLCGIFLINSLVALCGFTFKN